MRRFFHAVTIAGVLTPAVAFAQTAPSNGTGTAPTQTAPATTPASGDPSAQGTNGASATGTAAPTTGDDSNSPEAQRRRAASGSNATTTSTAGSTSQTAPATGSATATTANSANSAATLPTNPSQPGHLSDRNAPAANASSAAPAPLIWRGTSFIIDNSTSWETLFPGSQLSQDPSLVTFLSFRPRVQLGRYVSLRLRQNLLYEWFNSSSYLGNTTYLHQPILNDTWIDAAITGLPRLWGIAPSIAVRIALPLSLASQARHNYFTASLVLGASRSFQFGRAGDLNVGLTMVGSVPVNGAQGPQAMGAGYNCMDINAGPLVCNGFGYVNSVFTLATALSLAYSTPVRGLAFSALGMIIDQWKGPTADATLMDMMAGTVVVPHSPQDQRFAQFPFFSVAVDYEVAAWLSLSLSYWTSRNSVLNMDSTIANPFWGPNGQTRFSFTVTIPLDEVYAAITRRNVRETNTGGGANTRGLSMNERAPGSRRGVANDAARMVRERSITNGFF